MKKLILLVSLTLVQASNLMAWEKPRNPDRFPSIGFNVSSQHLTGDQSVSSGPTDLPWLTNTDSGYRETDSFGADVRLPINDGVTLSLGYDQVQETGHLTRQENVARINDSFKGYKVSFGVRVYMNK